jgi:hypothetical protein
MAFVITIPTTQLLYRSANNIADLPGYWFGFDANDTVGYGSITAEFRPVRELKLIDITRQDFYDDYICKIVERSKIDPSMDSIKDVMLFPLGYINMEVYRKYCNMIGLTQAPLTNMNVELATQFFYNRSRCSVKQLDINFINYLHTLYPYCDGIISQIKLPNVIYNGFHHAEVGVFDKSLMIQTQIVPRTIHGGTVSKIVGAVDIKHPIFDEATRIINKIKLEHANKVNMEQESKVNMEQANVKKRRYTRKNKHRAK